MFSEDYFKGATKVVCGFNGYMGDVDEKAEFGKFFRHAIELSKSLVFRIVIPGEWVLRSVLPNDPNIRYKVDDEMSHLPSFILVETNDAFYGVLFWLNEAIPLDGKATFALRCHYDPMFCNEQP